MRKKEREGDNEDVHARNMNAGEKLTRRRRRRRYDVMRFYSIKENRFRGRLYLRKKKILRIFRGEDVCIMY